MKNSQNRISSKDLSYLICTACVTIMCALLVPCVITSSTMMLWQKVSWTVIFVVLTMVGVMSFIYTLRTIRPKGGPK